MARSSHSHKDKASIVSSTSSKAEDEPTPEPSYRLKQPVHDTANINNNNSNNVKVKVVNQEHNAGGVLVPVTKKKKKKNFTPQRKAKEKSTTKKTSVSVSVSVSPKRDAGGKATAKATAVRRPEETSRTHGNDKRSMTMTMIRSSKLKQGHGSAADVNAVRLRQPAHLVANAPATVGRGRGGGAGAITGSGRPGLETQRTERRTNVNVNVSTTTKRTNMGLLGDGEPPNQPARHAPSSQHQTQPRPQPRRRVHTRRQEEEEHQNVDAEVFPTAASARPARNDVMIAAAKESNSKSKLPDDEPSAAPSAAAAPRHPTRMVQEDRTASITSCMTLDSSFGSMVSSRSRSTRSTVSSGHGAGGQDFVPPPSSARISPMLPAYSEEGDSEEGGNFNFYGELELDDDHGAVPHYRHHSSNNNNGQEHEHDDEDGDDWPHLRDSKGARVRTDPFMSSSSPSPPPLSNAAGRKTLQQYDANDTTDLTPIIHRGRGRGSGRTQDNPNMDDDNDNVEVEVHSDEVNLDLTEGIATNANNAIVKQNRHQNRRKKKKHPQPQRAHPKARAAARDMQTQVVMQMQAEHSRSRSRSSSHSHVEVGNMSEPSEPDAPTQQPPREMPPRTCSRRTMQAMKLKSHLNERRRSNRALLREKNASGISQSSSSLFHVDFRHVGAAVRLQSAYRRYRAVIDRRFEVLAVCCCISIQSMARQYLCVHQFQDTIFNIIISQSVVRRYLTKERVERREIALFEEQQSQEVEASKWYGCAADQIQASWRRYDAYWTYAQNFRDILTCQSVVRRFLVLSGSRQQHVSVMAEEDMSIIMSMSVVDHDHDNLAWCTSTSMAPTNTGFEVEVIPRFDVLGAIKRDQSKSPVRIPAVQLSNEDDASAWNPFADSDDNEDDDSTRTFDNDNGNDSSIDSGRVNLGHADEDNEDDNYHDSFDESIKDEDEEQEHDHYADNYDNSSPNLSPIREVEHEVDTTPQRLYYCVEADHVSTRSVDSAPCSDDPSLLTMVVSIAASSQSEDDEGDDASSLGGQDSDSHSEDESDVDAESEGDDSESTQEEDDTEDCDAISVASSSSVLLSPPSLHRRIHRLGVDVDASSITNGHDAEPAAAAATVVILEPAAVALAVPAPNTATQSPPRTTVNHVVAVPFADADEQPSPPIKLTTKTPAALWLAQLKAKETKAGTATASSTGNATATASDGTSSNNATCNSRKWNDDTITASASSSTAALNTRKHHWNHSHDGAQEKKENEQRTRQQQQQQYTCQQQQEEPREEVMIATTTRTKSWNDKDTIDKANNNKQAANNTDIRSDSKHHEHMPVVRVPSPFRTARHMGHKNSAKLQALKEKFAGGVGTNACAPPAAPSWQSQHKLKRSVLSQSTTQTPPNQTNNVVSVSVSSTTLPSTSTTPTTTTCRHHHGEDVILSTPTSASANTQTRTTPSPTTHTSESEINSIGNISNALEVKVEKAAASTVRREWTIPSSSSLSTRVNVKTKQQQSSSPTSVMDTAASEEGGGVGGVSGKEISSQWQSRITTTRGVNTHNAGNSNPFQPVRRVGQGNAARLKALQEKSAGGGNSN
jgi:hypothetical protein